MVKRVAKTVAWVLFVKLCLIIGVGIFLFFSGEQLLERYAKREIEERGSVALGVPVSVGAFDVSFADRRLVIRDLEIANPEGFDTPYAFRVKGMQIALGDITRDLVTIKDVNISDITVYYTAQSGGSNLIRIRENLENFQANRVQAQPLGEQNTESDFVMPKVIIDRFYFKGAKVVPEMKIIAGQGINTKVNLSEIALENIGADTGGVTLADASEEILRSFNSRVRTAVARAGLFEGLTQVGLMAVTGGVPILGVSDEILGLIGLDGDDDEESVDAKVVKKSAPPKSISATLNQ